MSTWEDARRETRAAKRALQKAARENVKAQGGEAAQAALREAADRMQVALERERDEWQRATGREP